MKKKILIFFSLICIFFESQIVNFTDIIDTIIIGIGISAQVMLIFGLLFTLPLINEFMHLIYAFLIIIIPLLSLNKNLLLLHILIIIWTLSLRKIYSQCIWRSFENKIKKFSQPTLNWDILFPILGTVSLSKLIYSD